MIRRGNEAGIIAANRPAGAIQRWHVGSEALAGQGDR